MEYTKSDFHLKQPIYVLQADKTGEIKWEKLVLFCSVCLSTTDCHMYSKFEVHSIKTHA